MTVVPRSHNENRLAARAGLQAHRPHEVRLIRAYSVVNVLARPAGAEFHCCVEQALAEAVETVLEDVRRTTSLEPVIEEEDWVRQQGTASALLGFEGESGRRGVYVQTNSPLTERLLVSLKSFRTK